MQRRAARTGATRVARRPHRPQVAQITAFVTRLHETVSIFHADLRELSRGFAFCYPKNTQHLILIQHEQNFFALPFLLILSACKTSFQVLNCIINWLGIFFNKNKKRWRQLSNKLVFSKIPLTCSHNGMILRSAISMKPRVWILTMTTHSNVKENYFHAKDIAKVFQFSSNAGMMEVRLRTQRLSWHCGDHHYKYFEGFTSKHINYTYLYLFTLFSDISHLGISSSTLLIHLYFLIYIKINFIFTAEWRL